MPNRLPRMAATLLTFGGYRMATSFPRYTRETEVDHYATRKTKYVLSHCSHCPVRTPTIALVLGHMLSPPKT